MRPEPSLSVTYHGVAAELPGFVKSILAGKDVRIPTRAPAKEDDYSLRGLLIEEARRKNSPTYPKTSLPTAWGKPAKGLQAGVRINPAVEVPDAAAVLEVVIRNVGADPRVFTHLQLAFGGESANETLTSKGVESVSRFMPKGSRMAAYVSPGDSYPLAVVPLFRPGDGRLRSLPQLKLRPGENRVGMEAIVVRLGGGEMGEDVELSTGYLDVMSPEPKK